MNDTTVATPGSPAAVKNGCKCPVLDNNYGRGATKDDDGKAWFWTNNDCPLHGRRVKGEATNE